MNRVKTACAAAGLMLSACAAVGSGVGTYLTLSELNKSRNEKLKENEDTKNKKESENLKLKSKVEESSEKKPYKTKWIPPRI